MRAAHVIKGAAANLMCAQLRQASYNLEQAASRAHEASNSATTTATTMTTVTIPPELIQNVQLYYNEMQQARQNFLSYLQSIGV
jgi:HPt (histidine-containing phosphotransfer) domain-containing protein